MDKVRVKRLVENCRLQKTFSSVFGTDGYDDRLMSMSDREVVEAVEKELQQKLTSAKMNNSKSSS